MKYVKICFMAIFTVFITLVGIMTLNNENKVSELEARNLTLFRKPTAEEVLDGTWENDTNTAFSDQLEFRNFFVSAYYKITMQKYTGDVAEGSHKQLYSSAQKEKDWQKYEKELVDIAKEINGVADNLAANGTKFIFVSIPRKDAVMTDYLPRYYTSSDKVYKKAMKVLKKNFNKNVIVIDGYYVFKKSANKGNDCYFSTDHHITFYGGMYIYEKVMKYVSTDYPNVPVLTVDDYDVEKVTVIGSFNRLIGNRITSDPEPLCVALKNPFFTYTRTESGKPSNKKIWGENVNAYTLAYMERDNAETVVTTTNENSPNILITGSSFSNVLETLLVPSCHVMASVDYRHNETGKSVEQYAEELEADYVIYIPSQSNDALSISKMKTHLGH